MLVAEQLRHETSQELSLAPQLLEKSYENTEAMLHALHLAARQYPLAYSYGHRSFDVNAKREMFNHRHMQLYGIGVGKQLLAGMALYVPPRHRSIFGEEAAMLSYLIRLKNTGYDSSIKGVGKLLLIRAVTEVLDQDKEQLKVDVVSSNKPARQLYECAGFRPGQLSHLKNESARILHMSLQGQPSLHRAKNTLEGETQ